MEAWKKRKGFLRGESFVTKFEPAERELLGNVAVDVAEKLIARQRSAPKDELAEMTGMKSGHSDKPTDPGLAHLLPDFEKPDAQEFDGDNSMLRQLHEPDIITAKLNNLRTFIDALGPDGGVNVTVNSVQAGQWVAALNDIRLYRAGLLISEDGTLPEPSPETQDEHIFIEWLAYCQESLLHAWQG